MGNKHYCVQRIPDCIKYIADRYYYYYTAHHLNKKMYETWVEAMDFEYGDIDDWKLLVEHNMQNWIQPGYYLSNLNDTTNRFEDEMRNIKYLLWNKMEVLDRVYCIISEGYLDQPSLERFRYRAHTRGDYGIEFSGALYEASR